MNDRASFHDLPALHDATDATSSASSAWLPLSDAQRAVWLDLQLGADPLAYLLAGRVRLEGELDFELLAQSLRVLSGRHDALRLQVDAHQPRQRLIEVGSQALPFFEHDLSARTPETVEAALEQLMTQKLSEPLLLGESVLFQVDMVKLSPTCHELLWRFHHLIADVTTITLVVARWAQTYAVLAGDVAMDLPPGSSFVATLASDAAYRASPQAEQDLAYWRRRFDDVPALVLPRRSGGPHPAHAPKTWSISGAEHAQWHASCAKAGVTEQRALVALLALALGTRHDRRDLTVGMALHRRDRQTLGVVGMMAAALPVRCQWQADDSLRQAVRGIAEQLDQDYRHQRAPIDAIGRALSLGQRGQPALFDLSISYTVEEAALTIPAPGGVRMTPRRVVPSPIVALPVLAVERPTEKRLDFELGWNPEYLSPAQADSVIATFQRLLQQFCQQPNLPVAELEPCSPAEHTLILDQFNRPHEPLPALMLHQRFRAQAATTPDAPALVDGERTLSYAELDQRSDALARRLRRALHDAGGAAQPEPVVGVALPRSADTVVALLAILKAGAVYLPLDTAYPLQRLQYLLDDAQAALLIDARGPDSPTATLNATRVDWHNDWSSDSTGDAGDTALDERLQPERLAYVIYTSGSTGQPKPVGMSHRATLNLDHARQAHDPIGPGDRVLAAISVGFDVSIGQLLLPLLRGATIVIAPALRTLEAEQFWALLAQHGVTHINSVPSFFDTVSEALMHQPEAQRYRGLKQLMVGGEALSGALAAKLQQRLPGTRLVNMYGPTETCIDATAYIVPDARHTALPTMLPIGTPLPNYRAYVLDSQGRLLPPGVPGELCIGGGGLARGYLGRPDATAEKFTADPFAEHFGAPGARLYRTGDVACWREDGQIEFLGRNDHQVKIRGHRIETGEIEEVLLQHEAVQQAAVIARKDSHGQARLYGYVVPKAVDTDATALTQALPAWLGERLPEHMVPSALVCLPALPLTPNGKLDLRALPQLTVAPQGRREYIAPEGEVETLLATLWSELLRVPQVGRDDEFFALGGHSLLAINLVERLRQADWHITVATLFHQPRLRDMALACRRGAPAAPAADTIPDGLELTAEERAHIASTIPGGEDNLETIQGLTALQQGMLFEYLQHTQGDLYLSPNVLSFASETTLQAWVAALEQVVQRHGSLRSSLCWEGLSQPVQVVHRSVHVPLQTLQVKAGQDALTALRQHLAGPSGRLELSQAPLLRLVRAHDVAQGRWLLAVCVHHVVLDHISLGVVMQELLAIHQGQAHLLPPAVTAWSAAPSPQQQAQQAQQEQQAQAFFHEMLSDIDVTTAPYGVLTAATQASDVHERQAQVPAAVLDRVRQAARAAGVSVASVAHLAWALVLGRTSAQSTVVMGTVLSGRLDAQPGTQRAVGMLINTLPLRIDLQGQSVTAALQATHQRLTQLMRHERASLAAAQRCSGVTAPLPLFTAMLNYRTSTPMSALAQAAMGVEWVFGQQLTGYPLALAVDDDGQTLTLTAQAVAGIDPGHVLTLMQTALAQLTQALAQDHATVDTPAATTTLCEALDLLTAQDRSTLLERYNSPIALGLTQAPALAQAGVGPMLQDHLRAQARATPDAVAVLQDEQQLSYRALDERSDALAQRLLQVLHAKGLSGSEPVVAVALPRSLETVVALVAILKAGAVYLPLDIAHPLSRLQYMLDDSDAALLIDEPDGVTAALQGTRLSDGLPADPTDLIAWPQDADPHRLAYVFYTSGSTGLPKPVGVSHESTLNLDRARQRYYTIETGDRVLAGISVGFDPSIGQLLLPLLHGAAVVMVPPVQTLEAQQYWALMARYGVTHVNSVPSYFDAVSTALLEQPVHERYQGLKHLILGGESFSGALADKLRRCLPQTQIVNIYGPTEATVDATVYVVPSPQEQATLATALPIGRPLLNYSVHVLDSAGRLVPPGVEGELCIGGLGVARGYLGRPEVTAEKFVADPYSHYQLTPATQGPRPGARLYKTGDVARWNAQGELEFLGRRDQQVKLRGQRIETAEIEAALLQHEQVQHAAVVLRKDAQAQAHLVGYVVGHDSQAPTPTQEALKAWLRERLPEHMVPTGVVWVASLPLTTNGKLDLRALPDWAPTDLAEQQRAAFVAPQDEIERVLQQAWQSVFAGLEIGLDDNFFALGGDSLRAIRLISACQQALRQQAQPELSAHVRLPTLLAQPTLRAMADAVRQSRLSGAEASPTSTPTHPVLVPLRPHGQHTPLFCVHPHNGMVWCYTPLIRHLDPQVPVWGLRALGLDAGETPLTDIPAMAAVYVKALRHVQAQGPYRLLGYSAGGVIAHEMARQLRQAGQHIEELTLLDAPYQVSHEGQGRERPSDAQTLREAAVLLGAPADAPPPQDVAALYTLMVERGLAEPGSTADSAQRLLDTAEQLAAALQRHAPSALDLPAATHVLQVHALRRPNGQPSTDWTVVLGHASTVSLALDTDHLGLVHPDMLADIAQHVLALSTQDRNGDPA